MGKYIKLRNYQDNIKCCECKEEIAHGVFYLKYHQNRWANANICMECLYGIMNNIPKIIVNRGRPFNKNITSFLSKSSVDTIQK